MRKPIITILLTAFLAVMFFRVPAFAGDLVLSSEYHPVGTEETFPDVLNIGTGIECGDLTIKLTFQPILTRSGHGIISDQDTRYLVIRLSITNGGEETVGWLTSDSFSVEETYLNQIYGTYRLNTIMSAKMASGYHLPAFFTSIAPGKTVQTVLVFSVYPDVSSWILNIAPRETGETEAQSSVRFQLPKALVQ